MFWRLLNPLRHLRLERENERLSSVVATLAREVATLDIRMKAQQRGVRSLVASVSRQATPGEVTDLCCQITAMGLRLHAIDVAVGLARDELRNGRHWLADEYLEQIQIAPPVIQQREAS